MKKIPPFGIFDIEAGSVVDERGESADVARQRCMENGRLPMEDDRSWEKNSLEIRKEDAGAIPWGRSRHDMGARKAARRSAKCRRVLRKRRVRQDSNLQFCDDESPALTMKPWARSWNLIQRGKSSVVSIEGANDATRKEDGRCLSTELGGSK